MNRLLSSFAVLLVLLVPAAPASADLFINFEQSNGLAGGAISYAGGAAGAVGTNIGFDRMVATNGSSVTLDCVGCVLNFTTGANTVSTYGLWAWGSGGSIVLTGTVLLPDSSVLASGTLLQGSFSGPVPASAVLGAGNLLRFSGSGFDVKHQALLDYFGASNNEFVHSATAISAPGCLPNVTSFAFNCRVHAADITNQNIPGENTTDVPEPGLLALFGLGVGALVVTRRVSRTLGGRR